MQQLWRSSVLRRVCQRGRMQAIIFIGIQATGKTTFYVQRFLNTHVRISLDLLRTRHREARFLDACLQTQQRFVVDKTNPTKEDRKRYIELARHAGYEVVGYYEPSCKVDFELPMRDAYSNFIRGFVDLAAA